MAANEFGRAIERRVAASRQRAICQPVFNIGSQSISRAELDGASRVLPPSRMSTSHSSDELSMLSSLL
jgi:hypothetical protein